MLAYDRTAGPDARNVGWKARIQRWDGSSWVTVATTSISKAKATDTHWPTFQTKTVNYHEGLLVDQIRVVYSLYWYGADGHTVKATATHFPKWYAWSNGSKVIDSCTSRVLTG